MKKIQFPLIKLKEYVLTTYMNNTGSEADALQKYFEIFSWCFGSTFS